MKRGVVGVIACFAVFTAMPSRTAEELLLERRTILDGRVSLLVPLDFQPAPEEELRLKYPGANRPSVVLEDKSGSINIGFDLKDVKVTDNDIPAVNAALEQQIKAKHPSAKWVKTGPIEIDGHPFALLDVYTPAIDTQMRNMIVATRLDGRLLMVTVNYPGSKDERWEGVAKSVISSISIVQKD